MYDLSFNDTPIMAVQIGLDVNTRSGVPRWQCLADMDKFEG